MSAKIYINFRFGSELMVDTNDWFGFAVHIYAVCLSESHLHATRIVTKEMKQKKQQFCRRDDSLSVRGFTFIKMQRILFISRI